MNKTRFVDEKGNDIDVSVIGFFKIQQLEKEYVMYALVDNNPNNEKGLVLLGEVIRNDDNVQILGILPEEKEMVIAYYNEISNQIGGMENE